MRRDGAKRHLRRLWSGDQLNVHQKYRYAPDNFSNSMGTTKETSDVKKKGTVAPPST